MISNYEYYRNGLFPVPNEIFTLGLVPGEIAVYICLLHMTNWKTKICYPSLHTIADAVGCSKNTALRYVRKLEEKCLIYTERSEVVTRKHGVRNGNLIFTIRPIQDAIDHRISVQEEYNLRRRNEKKEIPSCERKEYVQKQFLEEKLPF